MQVAASWRPGRARVGGSARSRLARSREGWRRSVRGSGTGNPARVPEHAPRDGACGERSLVGSENLPNSLGPKRPSGLVEPRSFGGALGLPASCRRGCTRRDLRRTRKANADGRDSAPRVLLGARQKLDPALWLKANLFRQRCGSNVGAGDRQGLRRRCRASNDRTLFRTEKRFSRGVALSDAQALASTMPTRRRLWTSDDRRRGRRENTATPPNMQVSVRATQAAALLDCGSRGTSSVRPMGDLAVPGVEGSHAGRHCLRPRMMASRVALSCAVAAGSCWPNCRAAASGRGATRSAARHRGVAVRVSRFPQQVEGLDDVIALAAVGLALGALKASQETIDAKRQRVARSLGFRELIAHMPTTVISRCRCSR